MTKEKIFKKHYLKASGKNADDAIINHMTYCLDAMEEYAQRLVKESNSLPCVSMRDLYGELREMGIPADYADRVAGWAKTL